MHCTRHDCSDRQKLVTDHGISQEGLPTCRNCGDYLSDRPLALGFEPAIDPLASLFRAGPYLTEQKPWVGSWGRLPDGQWGLRVYLPDNHRDGSPSEGDKVIVSTRSGKVSAMKLGALVTSTRTTFMFAAPPRKSSTPFAALLSE